MKKKAWGLIFFVILTLGSSVVISKNVEDTLIKSISIVSAIGIDSSDEGYEVTLQMINTAAKPDSAGEVPGSIIYQQSGRTISQAIKNILNRNPKKIFLDSAELIVIGEQTAREQGIHEILALFLTESEISSSIRIMVTKDYPASKIIRTITPAEKVSSKRINDIVHSNELNLGSVAGVYPVKVMNDLLRNIKATAIPYVTLSSDQEIGSSQENISSPEPEVLLILNGMAYFKKDKLAGYLSRDESKIFLGFTNNTKKATIETKCGAGFFTVHIKKSKTSVKPVYNNGMISFQVARKMKGELFESTCNKDDLPYLESKAERAIKNEMVGLIAKSQEENNDFLGFLKEVYLRNPYKFQAIKKKWKELYPEVPVEVEVDLEIEDIGDVNRIP
ncbi:Ger(x)C family spore germination protein [Metabacillus indicus]|uniref:Ger(x)C family spore germination protein n=1 Tax=Metabacillus indicus TaxID=246786 RepID=UPI002A013597|nr:Ger(x)C family spore germination protein [Metabacillus indicus]MDX8288637.1 Ger(x)C family spore germination protein [Metabacillus indicus]